MPKRHHSVFSDEAAYRPNGYRLLPFNFRRIGNGRYALGTMGGDIEVIDREVFIALTDGSLPSNSDNYRHLQSLGFICDESGDWPIRLTASKLATRLARNAELTSLFMFVVTLRCDHTCQYCQVSRQNVGMMQFDMAKSTAQEAVALMFQSPSPSIKVEFQGGEPLLNFPLIEFIVTESERINEIERRDLQFVVATNLVNLAEEHISFFRAHNVFVSTSVDGPAFLHDRNRQLGGKSVTVLPAPSAGFHPDRVCLGDGRGIE